MKKIKEEVLNNTSLPLYEEREVNKVFPVIGEGSYDADIMFIGEAPGRNEAKFGRPFCGESGKLLDELLSLINIDRENVYITNIIKDRPPFNRDPSPEEITSYSPYLDRQIEIIRPKVIATLGRYSMRYILDKLGCQDVKGSISELHGKEFTGKHHDDEVVIVPLFHPAVAIYNRNRKSELIDDFKILEKYNGTHK
jgi:DNA polymerase